MSRVPQINDVMLDGYMLIPVEAYPRLFVNNGSMVDSLIYYTKDQTPEFEQWLSGRSKYRYNANVFGCLYDNLRIHFEDEQDFVDFRLIWL